MDEGGRLEQRWSQYLQQLHEERTQLQDCTQFQLCSTLVQQEIERVQVDIRAGGRPEERFIDLSRDRPIRLSTRLLVPVQDHPKFNFVGKLLGPKGNSLKRLQEETLTKMAILGRGSMRDKDQEEQLRKAKSPRSAHLFEDLHVEIVAFAPPTEAYARIALALTMIRHYMVPDSHDQIRQQQMCELKQLVSSEQLPAGTAGSCSLHQQLSCPATAVATAAVGSDTLPTPDQQNMMHVCNQSPAMGRKCCTSALDTASLMQPGVPFKLGSCALFTSTDATTDATCANNQLTAPGVQLQSRAVTSSRVGQLLRGGLAGLMRPALRSRPTPYTAPLLLRQINHHQHNM